MKTLYKLNCTKFKRFVKLNILILIFVWHTYLMNKHLLAFDWIQVCNTQWSITAYNLVSLSVHYYSLLATSRPICFVWVPTFDQNRYSYFKKKSILCFSLVAGIKYTQFLSLVVYKYTPIRMAGVI